MIGQDATNEIGKFPLGQIVERSTCPLAACIADMLLLGTERLVRSRPLAAHFQRGVADNTQQPGLERRPPREGLEAGKGLDEALLDGVERVCLVTQPADGHAKSRLLIAPEQVVEGIQLPRRVTQEQLLVACLETLAIRARTGSRRRGSAWSEARDTPC